MQIAKRESHRLALCAATTSDNPRFFLGTDSAPHLTAADEAACGCAGVFSAINTMSCLAHVFEQEGALDRLEGFTSLFGLAFHNLPANEQRIRLVRREKAIRFPQSIDSAFGPVTVFDPMFLVHWQVKMIGAATG